MNQQTNLDAEKEPVSDLTGQLGIMPIDTAPKDRRILLLYSHLPRWIFGQYDQACCKFLPECGLPILGNKHTEKSLIENQPVAWAEPPIIPSLPYVA